MNNCCVYWDITFECLINIPWPSVDADRILSGEEEYLRVVAITPMILFDVGVDDDDVTRLVGVDAGLLDDVNAEVDLAEVDEGICVVDDEFFF